MGVREILEVAIIVESFQNTRQRHLRAATRPSKLRQQPFALIVVDFPTLTTFHACKLERVPIECAIMCMYVGNS